MKACLFVWVLVFIVTGCSQTKPPLKALGKEPDSQGIFNGVYELALTPNSEAYMLECLETNTLKLSIRDGYVYPIASTHSFTPIGEVYAGGYLVMKLNMASGKSNEIVLANFYDLQWEEQISLGELRAVFLRRSKGNNCDNSFSFDVVISQRYSHVSGNLIVLNSSFPKNFLVTPFLKKSNGSISMQSDSIYLPAGCTYFWEADIQGQTLLKEGEVEGDCKTGEKPKGRWWIDKGMWNAKIERESGRHYRFEIPVQASKKIMFNRR